MTNNDKILYEYNNDSINMNIIMTKEHSITITHKKKTNLVGVKY